MNLRTIPIAAASIPVSVIRAGVGVRVGNCEEFCEVLQRYTGRCHAMLLNSGIAALLLVLKTLGRTDRRTEVILPAYTAGSLVVAVRQAGLVPVLCDMDLRSGGMAGEQLSGLVTDRTLAIIGVHLFGLVERSVADWKQRFPHVYIIEDACQAMGSIWQGRPVGGLGDANIFSFNKGKNLPLVNGGVLLTDDDELAERLKADLARYPKPSGNIEALKWVQMLALSFVIRPPIYSLVYPLLGRYREVAPPEHIRCAPYTNIQSAMGIEMLKRIEAQAKKRHENALALTAGLRDVPNISLFDIHPDSRPAMNRFPILIQDEEFRKRIEEGLSRRGIETSRFYLKPLHHMFDLGYPADAFPQACEMASKLLTIPCHPLLTQRDIFDIVELIKGT